jgi:prepilin-type N-terminal cleavage/methylation domain-containing protein
MSHYRYGQNPFIALTRRTLNKNRGETLIEVLVASFIISIGVLGAAGMQVATLKNLSASDNRGQVVMLVENLTENMKAIPATEHPALIAQYNQSQDIKNLPSGSLRVNQANGIYTVTVRWDEDLSGSDENTCPVLSSADLDCYQATFST